MNIIHDVLKILLKLNIESKRNYSCTHQSKNRGKRMILTLKGKPLNDTSRNKKNITCCIKLCFCQACRTPADFTLVSVYSALLSQFLA